MVTSCSIVLALLLACFPASLSIASGGETHELQMTLEDVFRVTQTDRWRVTVERYMPLRLADVRIENKKGYAFSLMLYFKCDTPDLSDYDSPEKIKRSVLTSSRKYLPVVVEKKVELHKVPVHSSYGFYTVLTDARLVDQTTTEPGEFKYLTRGMVRLSKNSALGFSLMTNDVNSSDYWGLLDYVYSFVKPGPKR